MVHVIGIHLSYVWIFDQSVSVSVCVLQVTAMAVWWRRWWYFWRSWKETPQTLVSCGVYLISSFQYEAKSDLLSFAWGNKVLASWSKSKSKKYNSSCHLRESDKPGPGLEFHWQPWWRWISPPLNLVLMDIWKLCGHQPVWPFVSCSLYPCPLMSVWQGLVNSQCVCVGGGVGGVFAS